MHALRVAKVLSEQNNSAQAGFSWIPLCRAIGIYFYFVFFHIFCHHIISTILNLSSSLPLNLDKSKVASKLTASPSDRVFLKESMLEKKETALALLLESEKKNGAKIAKSKRRKFFYFAPIFHI